MHSFNLQLLFVKTPAITCTPFYLPTRAGCNLDTLFIYRLRRRRRHQPLHSFTYGLRTRRRHQPAQPVIALIRSY